MEEKIGVKTLGKALLGIPIGVTFLVLCYISIHYVVSAEAYKAIAMDLTDINTFILQLITMSAVGYIIILFTNITSTVSYNAEKNKSSKLSILGVPALMGLTYFIPSLIIVLTRNIFNQDLYMLIIAFGLVFFGSIFIVGLVAKSITQEKINKRIKEKNNL